MTWNKSTVDTGDWDETCLYESSRGELSHPSESAGEICELIWQISLDRDGPLFVPPPPPPDNWRPGELPPFPKKLPPKKNCPPKKLSPRRLPPGKLPPGELPPWRIAPLENCPLENCPPGELPPGELPPGELPPWRIAPLENCPPPPWRIVWIVKRTQVVPKGRLLRWLKLIWHLLRCASHFYTLQCSGTVTLLVYLMTKALIER